MMADGSKDVPKPAELPKIVLYHDTVMLSDGDTLIYTLIKEYYG